MRIALIATLFLVPFALPFLLLGLRLRRWGLPVRVKVDPDDPSPEAIGGYLAEIAQRLDARPERMRIVFDGRTAQKHALALDVGADRALRISMDGGRPHRLDLRARWIADHPVPLDLRRAVLYVEPVEANRFRVMTRVPFSVPPFVYVVCSLVATLGVVRLSPELLAVALGLATGCALVAALGKVKL